MTPLTLLRSMLARLEERHDAYCPRCDRVTGWWNACRDGIHRSFQCGQCGLQEAGRLTEAEAARLEARQ